MSFIVGARTKICGAKRLRSIRGPIPEGCRYPAVGHGPGQRVAGTQGEARPQPRPIAEIQPVIPRARDRVFVVNAAQYRQFGARECSAERGSATSEALVHIDGL